MPLIFYIAASISIVFATAVFGLLLNNALNRKAFYKKFKNMNFLKSENANRYIGVILMKRIIIHSFWKNLNPALRLNSAEGKGNIIRLYDEMTNAEISHLIGFLLTLIIILISYWADFHSGIIVPLMVANIIFHLYPALLQQYNKRRIKRFLEEHYNFK
ncbi:hypothetical protein [Flavobacterium sp. MK4S-17]|uniref:glycosyl-4,4'-diaponeurosporenoate acyltransferase CrtO family protein n=1 Tax=Flavobacterium sp. MK4S-17 TaxID=2543737 RepID=UPI002103E864|nr:hypothetical protein [Flavobacterium sp. MK4S-17]